ncbi:MAG: hypothetical protein MUC49_01900 [Raineya sp.]|jgi:hypothetical protein|nr:hypothetical protein [Raineya sp.]
MVNHPQDWQFDYASENDMYVTEFSTEELENYLNKPYPEDKICLYCVLFHKDTEKTVTVFGANNRFVVECWTNKNAVFQKKETDTSKKEIIYNYPDLGKNLEVLACEVMDLEDVRKIVMHFYTTKKPHPDYNIIKKSYIYS